MSDTGLSWLGGRGNCCDLTKVKGSKPAVIWRSEVRQRLAFFTDFCSDYFMWSHLTAGHQSPDHFPPWMFVIFLPFAPVFVFLERQTCLGGISQLHFLCLCCVWFFFPGSPRSVSRAAAVLSLLLWRSHWAQSSPWKISALVRLPSTAETSHGDLTAVESLSSEADESTRENNDKSGLERKEKKWRMIKSRSEGRRKKKPWEENTETMRPKKIQTIGWMKIWIREPVLSARVFWKKKQFFFHRMCGLSL